VKYYTWKYLTLLHAVKPEWKVKRSDHTSAIVYKVNNLYYSFIFNSTKPRLHYLKYYLEVNNDYKSLFSVIKQEMSDFIDFGTCFCVKLGPFLAF